MPTKGPTTFQIGKGGITPGVIDSLQNAFKTRKMVRVSILQNATRDRKVLKQMADQLVTSLRGTYKCRIIGFTIILRKMAKESAKVRKTTKQ